MLWALLILVLCGIPGRDIPHISFLELLNFDKFVHAGIFFVLLVLTVRGFFLQTTFLKIQHHPKMTAFACCVIYGALLEIMQGTLFEQRSADILDFIANTVGVAVGVLLYDRVERSIII